MLYDISVCHFKYHFTLNSIMFFNFIVFIIDIPLFKRYHTNRLNNNDIKRAIKITFWRKSMKKLSISKMADTVISKRKELKITQVQLAEKTGINRGMISRLESCDYTPSIEQLQSIAEILDFEVVDLFEDDKPTVMLSHTDIFPFLKVCDFQSHLSN